MERVNQNPIALLNDLMQQRYWHKGKIERRKAAAYKIKIATDGLSYQKACEILNLIGWQKVSEETWQKT